MFSVIASFLRIHWQTALIGFAMLTVFATLSVQHIEIGHLKRRLERCHAENVALEDSNRAMLVSISEQNSAILALETESKRRKAVSSRMVALAHKKATAYGIAVKRIEAKPLVGNECDAVKALLKKYAGSRRP